MCIQAFIISAQNKRGDSLYIGDEAPPLEISTWLKGSPIKAFIKGKVYVVEFWATWCQPCIAAMPHLSNLATEYKNKVTFLGIDVLERKNTSVEKIKAFVSGMGKRMNYNVAIENGNLMEKNWMESSSEIGIPVSFIINADGRVAWIGHPYYINHDLLDKVLSKEFDIEGTLADRNLANYLKRIDDSLYYVYRRFEPYGQTIAKPDSALILIDQTLSAEPRLKYAPILATKRFELLLRTGQQDKAIVYGKELLLHPVYFDLWGRGFEEIISIIEINKTSLLLQKEIYLLGVEFYKKITNQFTVKTDPKYVAKIYGKMAQFYWDAGDSYNALEILKKAIASFASHNDISSIFATEYYSKLNKWITNQQFDKSLQKADDSLKSEMSRYLSVPKTPGGIARPDTLLMAINELLKIRPELKYAPNVANWTLNSLLETNQQEKAYDYAKGLLNDSTYETRAYDVIIWSIAYYSNKRDIMPGLYLLGTEACKQAINNISDIYSSKFAPEYYSKMAEWYWHIGKKGEAIKAQEKSVELSKIRIDLILEDPVSMTSPFRFGLTRKPADYQYIYWT
jgi:thiol-disulfide isomerase/thioredoxin